MKKYTLITGASTGIGYQMALQLAARQHNLILVARSADRLNQLQQELKSRYGIEVHCMVKDLSDINSAIGLYQDVCGKGWEVTALVNNAGVGTYGEFLGIDLEKELKMITLNVSSLVVLTKLFARDMIARGSGRIMNVASLLSYFPLPNYSVYSATKAFVLSFSETLAAELESKGVVVTALCPGPVDTPFTTDDMLRTNAYKTNKPISPEIVAREGVKLLLSGKGTKIVGLNNWFIANLPRFTPAFILTKIKMALVSPQNNNL
jgi:short-subunit dehydrogenase